MAALSRLALLSMIVSAVTTVLLASAVTLGAVGLKARLTPKIAEREPMEPPGPLLTLADQVYNLSEPNRFVKATVALELSREEKDEKELAALVEEAKKRESQVREIIILTVNGMTFAEMNSPRGKLTFKNEVRKKVNELLARGEVKSVLFTTFQAQ